MRENGGSYSRDSLPGKFTEALRIQRLMSKVSFLVKLAVCSRVIIGITSIAVSTGGLRIPTVQNGAEHPRTVFRESLAGRERAFRRGLSRADHQHHAVRQVAEHASIRQMDH